jgi:hypothetical protein
MFAYNSNMGTCDTPTEEELEDLLWWGVPFTQDEESIFLEYHAYESIFDEEFDWFEHFGIPSDISEAAQDALLEAAVGSS